MKRPRTVVMIGNFDGVHLGHAALAKRAREVADAAGARVVALSFDPHPLAVLRPEAAPARLTTLERRAELLGRYGVDEVVRLEPTGNLLGQSPEEFIQNLIRDLAPVAVVEGPDFRFGRSRAGDLDLLRRIGRTQGFEVHVVSPPIEVALSDHSLVRASSTTVRWMVAHGRVGDAAALLGRPYEMTGPVVQGERRGRTIGYPTANLDSPCLVPADGVYSGIGVLPDGRRVPAAISVGAKPTFGNKPRTVEAYLLLNGGGPWHPIPGLPEYGWDLRLEFHHWLRDQARYDSLEPLLEQIERDVSRTRELEEVVHGV
jgi:riboflavin kinase/FMN adenylyltransferase